MPLSSAAIGARLLTTGLPTFPRTLAKLTHLIQEAEAPAQVVAAVVATDPSLSALVLGQAAAAGHVTTRLTEAIRRTGMGVMLTTARSAVPVEGPQRAVLAGCWAQANAVAVLLPIIADHRAGMLKARWDDETLHVLGLIHDLGHILALWAFPEAYARVAARLAAGRGDLGALIEEEFGAGPAELAGLAAAGLGLPPLATAAMTCWQRPGAANHSELAALLHIAHVLAQAAGFVAGGDRWLQRMDDRAMSTLAWRTADCEAVLERLFASMDELELYEGALGG